MKKIHLLILLMVVLGVASVAPGCVAADKDGSYRPGWLPANSSSQSVTETQTPALTYVTIVTPYPTKTVVTTGIPNPTLVPPPSRNISEVNYLEIFNSLLYFDWNATALEYEVTTPPLIIEYNVMPEMVSREMIVTSQYGSKKDETVTITSPNELSWFEVTVRDKNTQQIIIKDGFGKMYDWTTKKQITIRSPGNYHIELNGGKNVKVDFVMRVGNS
jgi:hypothetical protein